jgi:hypothetical protein
VEVVVAVEEVVVAAASTGRTLEVDDTVLVQSSQALPFSDGQDQELRLELVVAASTGRVLGLVELDETVVVQSNHALPFSDGHGQ